MKDNNLDFLPQSDEGLYNEKNDSVLAPDSYYENKEKASDESDERYYEVIEGGAPKTRVFSVVSLILGIVSILLSFTGWIGFIIGMGAIAFSVVSRIKLGYFDNMAIFGLLLGIFGIVFGAFYTILVWILGPNGLADMFSGIASPDTGSGNTINGI